MANRVVLSRANATQGSVRHIEGDTFAGLPVTGVSEGVTAWAIDTATLYFWNGATWDEFGTGGNPWDTVIESGYTAAEVLRILAAVAAGQTAIVDLGGGAATVTFRDLGDTKDRIEATMADSERTTLVIDET